MANGKRYVLDQKVILVSDEATPAGPEGRIEEYGTVKAVHTDGWYTVKVERSGEEEEWHEHVMSSAEEMGLPE